MTPGAPNPNADAPPEVPPARGFGRRLLRALAAPVRFACRRPARAALLLAAVAVALALGTGATARVRFERHLAAARAEVARGHNAAAAARLRTCRAVRPDDPEVLLLSARVARRSGAWEEAEELLTRAAARHGDGEAEVAERLFLRAARGDLEEVGAAVRARAAAGGPDAALAREALVVGLTYRFRWAEASALLAEWLAAEPDAPAALLLKGKLEEQRLGFPVARELYERIVALDPDHDEARLRLTTLLLADRRGGEAVPHLAVLRERLPGNPEVAVQWARALALQGRAGESRAALDACLRDRPDFAAALAERGAQALVAGDEDAAERDLARAVALDPGNVVARNQYALALARNGKRAEAAREEANIAALRADLDRMTALISGPLQNAPNDPALHHEIATIALRSGQLREALMWFTSALRVDPNHVPTHRALVSVYRALDNPVLAARHRALAQGLDGPAPKP